MKFLTQCMQDEDEPVDPNKTFGDYLKTKNLTANLLHYVCHSIAMVQPSETVTMGLKSTRKFLSSLGRFGSTPFLWSMYGTGELPQVNTVGSVINVTIEGSIIEGKGDFVANFGVINTQIYILV